MDFRESMDAAMDFIAEASHGKVYILRKDGTGKWYPTVALRVEAMRRHFDASYGIATEQLTREGDDPDIVVVRARVLHYSAPGSTAGRIIATGIAEEIRGDGMVNKTSALENCETSAIGRALGAFGLVGDEMASANEMETAVARQNKPLVTVEQSGELIQLCKDHGMTDEEIDQYRATLRVAQWGDLTEERATRLLVKMRAKYATDASVDAEDTRAE